MEIVMKNENLCIPSQASCFGPKTQLARGNHPCNPKLKTEKVTLTCTGKCIGM